MWSSQFLQRRGPERSGGPRHKNVRKCRFYTPWPRHHPAATFLPGRGSRDRGIFRHDHARWRTRLRRILGVARQDEPPCCFSWRSSGHLSSVSAGGGGWPATTPPGEAPPSPPRPPQHSSRAAGRSDDVVAVSSPQKVQRTARRLDGKARRPRISGIFERGATQPARMHRRSNAAFVTFTTGCQGASGSRSMECSRAVLSSRPATRSHMIHVRQDPGRDRDSRDRRRRLLRSRRENSGQVLDEAMQAHVSARRHA